MGVQLSPLVCRQLLGSFSVCEKLDAVHMSVRWRRWAQVYMYPSILAIQPYVLYVQLTKLIILNILPVGVQLSPLVCRQLLGSFSVCVKLDAVHKVYDGGGGLKYTCTLQY